MEPEAIAGTNKYRTAVEVFFTNSEGQNTLPVKGYTSAIIDEAEKGEMEFHGGSTSSRAAACWRLDVAAPSVYAGREGGGDITS